MRGKKVKIVNKNEEVYKLDKITPTYFAIDGEDLFYMKYMNIEVEK
jgi:hypothetical protein